MARRHEYEKCEKHKRAYCSYSECKIDSPSSSNSSTSDNAGSLSVNTDGGFSIGIGSGLAIDPSDGSIGFQIGGITIDT